ncbi:MAG: hypothetical protein JSV45_11860 [Chromatiales bacterium]|nr:MAG: hypothetical protein JSV45_11860 [Chromatiales bacterium]
MRSPWGDRRARAAAILAAALLLVAAPGWAGKPERLVVQDPHYGEVLFHFYQKDDFTALTHLMAAQAQSRVSNHELDAELLLGGLNLEYGQHREAGRIFNRLLAQVDDPAIRDRAWFYLGKVRYQRAHFAEAEDALRQVGGKLPRSLAAEYPLLMSQSLMGQGRYDDAAAVLDGWKGPADWTAFARFNLGVAQVRSEDLQAGARALNRVGKMSAPTPELKSLRDKANLALGYAWLQVNDPEAAREALERVRVLGPFSNKALLGVGWADALQAEYRRALVPWLELRDRDLLDSAVQESLLAVPFAYGSLDAHGSAVDAYLAALGAFDAEIFRLDIAIDRARSGELVPALLDADDPEIARWYWQLNAVPSSEDARYLYHLVADHRFQDGLRNYRDLLALYNHLDDWKEKLGAYQDMLDTRAQAYAERMPSVEAHLADVNLEAMHARRDDMVTRLDQIEATRDIAGLADATERQQWELLTELEQSPAWSHPGAAEARDKQRVLKGLLQWKLDREFRRRLWQQRREIASLDAALAEADRRAADVYAAREEIPVELDAYRERIAALRPRLESVQGGVMVALGGQEAALQLFAVRELEAQKERMATYRIQARFALATIYDRASGTVADRGSADQ